MTDLELVQALRDTETRSKRGLLDEAAARLDALADQLHYAQAERDVVTKRMIAMEIERATKESAE